MISPYVYEGISKGIQNVKQYVDTQEQRDMQLQQARNEAYAANSQTLKLQTFDAFNRYKADGDVKHLNNWMKTAKQNPVGASVYGDTVRIDNLYKSSENDQLLKQAGVQDLDAAYNQQDLLVVTTQTGRKLVPIDNLYAATGYTDYLDQKELTKLEQQARVRNALMQGQSGKTISLEEKVVQAMMQANPDLSIVDAYKAVKEQKGILPQEERAVRQIMEDNNMSYLDAMNTYYEAKGVGGYTSNEQAFIESYKKENPGATDVEASQAYANRGKTSTQKELVQVNEAKANLDAMNFFDTNMSDLSIKDRSKVYESIQAIEDLRGIKISNEEKRVLRDLRNLTQLGGQAGEDLTEQETGLIDTMLNSVKSYLVDEVGGKEATSAYETFRNSIRHALYGASLTATEVQAFQSAAGSLKQQLKPVLAQLKTQIMTIKNNLTSVRDLNDPYLAHYYVGTDIDSVDEVIRQLDERLGLINKAERSNTIPASVKMRLENAEPTQGNTKPVGSYFEGVNF